MKRLLGTALVVAVVVFVAMQRVNGTIVAAEKADKVTVCHADGNGRVRAISVSANAVPAHLAHGDPASCELTVFSWEVSTDGGTTWSPVTLPDTDWGCDHCTRFYRTFVTAVPNAVTFRFASDNEAQMLVNGVVTYNDWFITGTDDLICTQAICCSQCGDSFLNATNVVNAQTPLNLSLAALTQFHAGANELRWQVNQQNGGSGFLTVMTISY